MNKTLKGIFAGCGVLALLGGGLAVLKLTEPEEQESSSTSSEVEALPLWHVNSDDIAEITVEQPGGDTYTAVRRIDHVQSTDLDGNPTEEDITNYTIKGYEKIPMDTTGIRVLATRSPELNGISRVEENPADLSIYGLSEPIKVCFKVDNTDDVVFYIGNNTPDKSYCYLRVEGDDTVYTVGTVSIQPYREKAFYYLGKELTQAQADDDETIVESVRIERKDLDYDFLFEYDPYFKENTNGGSMALHMMKEPVVCMLNADKSTQATHGLYGLTASEVLTPFPTDADLKKAGLDDPQATVTMKTDDGKTTVFRMGDTYENADGNKYRYGYLEGIDCIYGFSADQAVYAELKPEDVTAKNIIDFYVWDIGKLTYSADGIKLDFDGVGESQDDYVVRLNGEQYDNVERFRKLYTFLLQTKAEELVLDEIKPTGKPMAEVYIGRQDKARSYNIKFYDDGGMKALIEVDGEVRYRCRKSYVTTLIGNMKIFDDAETEFTMTW